MRVQANPGMLDQAVDLGEEVPSEAAAMCITTARTILDSHRGAGSGGVPQHYDDGLRRNDRA